MGILAKGHTVSYREVAVAESDGKSFTITRGLQEGGRVVLNPEMGLLEGTRVQPFDAPEKRQR